MFNFFESRIYPITNFYIIDALIQKKWAIAGESFRHALWPALVLGAFTMGLITRTNRSSLLETMSMDYIRTARAKGLGEVAVVTRHAFGNAFIPVITVIGITIALSLGGSVIIERIFSLPGMGNFLVEGMNQRDYPVVQSLVLFFSMWVVIINLIVDLTYGWLDPRIRLE